MNPRQKLPTKSLVSHLILNCGLPVSIVDDPDFRQFLHDVDPQFSVFCRQTVTYAILPAITEGKHNKLQQLLKKSTSDLALTTDTWTDRGQHAFLGVTVHV